MLQEQAVRTFVDGHLSVEKAIAVWRVLRQTIHQMVVHLGQGQGVSDPYPRSPAQRRKSRHRVRSGQDGRLLKRRLMAPLPPTASA